MTTLAIETATDTCGVAVCVDGAVTAEVHLHVPRMHARRLTPMIEAVLEQAEVDREAIDVVAVSEGPGSYTGLRIGVSTAKGWARALDADVVAVPTLEALAAATAPYGRTGDVVCALLDARRDEVYAAAYRIGAPAEGPRELHVHAEVTACTVDALPEWLGEVDGEVDGGGDGGAHSDVWLVGTGARKSTAALQEEGAQRGYDVRVVPPHVGRPSAAWVARRAGPRAENGDTADLATFEPFYLKAFQAG